MKKMVMLMLVVGLTHAKVTIKDEYKNVGIQLPGGSYDKKVKSGEYCKGCSAVEIRDPRLKEMYGKYYLSCKCCGVKKTWGHKIFGWDQCDPNDMSRWDDIKIYYDDPHATFSNVNGKLVQDPKK